MALVSIHAPVKGATPLTELLKLVGVVSIHAPVKGATIDVTKYDKMRQVSIHAPVKGATIAFRDSKGAFNGFNPRTREGCDTVPISIPII